MATIRELLYQASRLLSEAGIDSPSLDAALLLGSALDLSREQLYARFTDPVPTENEERFWRLIGKRGRGTPVAYLRGTKEFYGREFLVGPRVLIPRPETEILVDVALELLAGPPAGIESGVHDCCTGSGCIAITLKAERPELLISASDSSPEALAVAEENCRRLLSPREPSRPSPIRFIESDLLSAVEGNFDLITANPPYVAENEVKEILRSGSPEPPEALLGGKTGVEIPYRLLEAALEHLSANGYLVMEVGYGQASGVLEKMDAAGYTDLGYRDDLQGIPRVVYGRR
jgi:release factor glutamine methyltransferase